MFSSTLPRRSKPCDFTTRPLIDQGGHTPPIIGAEAELGTQAAAHRTLLRHAMIVFL